MMAHGTEVIDAQLVQVVAQFPPRADAIITLLASDDYLPGAQTLLYSIQKTIDKNITYPPELVLLVTPDVSQKTRNALWPALCTRVLEVPILALPPGITGKVAKAHSKPWDNHCPGLTKLHAFRLDVYDSIVFIEPDCLVLDDLYPLIKKGKVYTETEALVAAAPDIFPPDKFNSGVMVIRPSQAVFDNMIHQRALLLNYDGSDTGFLNAYFPEWHTEMAPLARLPFTYNAQRVLYDMTYDKGHRSYWDLAVSPDLKIIHYSGTPKPWEGAPMTAPTSSNNNVGSNNNQQDDNTAASTSTSPPPLPPPPPSSSSSSSSSSTTRTGDYLTDLWRQNYQRSKNFVARFHKEREKEEAWKASERVRQKQQEQQAAKSAKSDPKQIHKLVSKRYKELRQEGHDVKTAMTMARAEQGMQDNDDDDDEPAAVGAKVASMFGIML